VAEGWRTLGVGATRASRRELSRMPSPAGWRAPRLPGAP